VIRTVAIKHQAHVPRASRNQPKIKELEQELIRLRATGVPDDANIMVTHHGTEASWETRPPNVDEPDDEVEDDDEVELEHPGA
jgi:hypothetical protein